MAEKRKDNKGRNLKENEFQEKNGRYKFRYRDHDGNLKTVYSWRLAEHDKYPAGKKQTESLREMEKRILRDLEDGIKIQKKTLDEYWVEHIEIRQLKQSTETNYRYMYKNYIQPELGYMDITAIKYSHVMRFMCKLIKEYEFKPNSVEVIYTILHPIFQTAMRDDIIRKNPTDGVMPEIRKSYDWTKKRKHPLSVREQAAFIDFMKNSRTYSHWLPLFTALLGTGCRIGEMLGLRWEDIDFTKKTISINHNLIYRQQNSGKCEYHITTPKTHAGIREIPMMEDVRKAFIQVRMDQLRTGTHCTSEIDGYSGFIWMNRYGAVLSPHSVNRVISRVVKDYNEQEINQAKKEKREPLLLPEFSAHILRHTFCTRYCENETDLKTIQEIMGHADISTTMDIYNESNEERKQASFDKLEGIIKIS